MVAVVRAVVQAITLPLVRVLFSVGESRQYSRPQLWHQKRTAADILREMK